MPNKDKERAVEWKIFEIQAALISSEATEKYLDLGYKWLQPRHYEEIIDERVSDGKCGYPLCLKSPRQSPGKSVRLAYSNIPKINNIKNYCSQICCDKSQGYLLSLDTTSPYTRKGAELLASPPSQDSEDINSVLNIICSDESKVRPNETKRTLQSINNKVKENKNNNSNIIDQNNNNNNNNSQSIETTGFLSHQNNSTNQEWVEKPHSNLTNSTKPKVEQILKIDPTAYSMQSLYSPTLLSYDPVQNVPPKHIPLGNPSNQPQSLSRPNSSTQSLNQNLDSEKDFSESDSSDEQTNNNGSINREALGDNNNNNNVNNNRNKNQRPATFTLGTSSNTIAQAILNLPIPETNDDGSGTNEKTKPSNSRYLKKSLSFGQDAVRIFKRGSYVNEQYTESEWESNKNLIKNQKQNKGKGINNDLIENNDGDEDSDEIHEVEEISTFQPSFDTQLNNWFSDNWGPKKSNNNGNKIQKDSKEPEILTSTIRNDLSTTYEPKLQVKEVKWAEPKVVEVTPPPTSLTTEQTNKALQEARERRKKAQKNNTHSINNSNDSKSTPTNNDNSTNNKNNKNTTTTNNNNNNPTTTTSSTTTSNNNNNPTQSKKSVKMEEKNSVTPKSSKIMKAKVVEKEPTTITLPDSLIIDNEDDSIEGYTSTLTRNDIRVSSQTTLSNLSVNPFMVNPDEYDDEDRKNDESLLQEILKIRPTINHNINDYDNREDNGDDSEGDENEDGMDSIVKQNFFLYMWTTLEDLFDYNVICWMNNNSDSNNLQVIDDGDINNDNNNINNNNDHDSDEDDESKYHNNNNNSNNNDNHDDDDNDNDDSFSRQPLHVPSLHHSEGILKHLNRGINHVEKIIQVDSFLLKYHLKNTSSSNENIYQLYLQSKKDFFSILHLPSNFNPSFNQKQWLFLSLIIIDSILCKKILLYENFNGLSNDINEIKLNWNNKFKAYVAGILGGADVANQILDERQIENLRQFFDIEN